MPSPEVIAAPDHCYTAYGLVIASAVALPELVPVAGEMASTPDITITLNLLPEIGPDNGPAGTRRIGPYLWATRDQFWFCVPGIARFRITGGHEIQIDPDPSGDAAGVRTFLLGTALGVALSQRGHVTLHGNAVRIGDGCLVCVGPSGAGKSTLAAGFARRGFAVLSDDLVMVDEHGRVPPGIPRIKLWADMAAAMAIDTAPLARIRHTLEKFSYPVRDGYAEAAVPVRAIYGLVGTNADTVSIRHLQGFAKFRAVRANIYRPQFVEAMGQRELYLARCTQLAATVSVAWIARPALGFTLDALVDAILEDVGGPD